MQKRTTKKQEDKVPVVKKITVPYDTFFVAFPNGSYKSADWCKNLMNPPSPPRNKFRDE